MPNFAHHCNTVGPRKVSSVVLKKGQLPIEINIKDGRPDRGRAHCPAYSASTPFKVRADVPLEERDGKYEVVSGPDANQHSDDERSILSDDYGHIDDESEESESEIVTNSAKALGAGMLANDHTFGDDACERDDSDSELISGRSPSNIGSGT